MTEVRARRRRGTQGEVPPSRESVKERRQKEEEEEEEGPEVRRRKVRPASEDGSALLSLLPLLELLDQQVRHLGALHRLDGAVQVRVCEKFL